MRDDRRDNVGFSRDRDRMREPERRDDRGRDTDRRARSPVRDSRAEWKSERGGYRGHVIVMACCTSMSCDITCVASVLLSGHICRSVFVISKAIVHTLITVTVQLYILVRSFNSKM